VNNIAPAHLERMHSLLGITETKAAVYDALPDNGIAVINADDAFAEFFAARVPGRKVVRFGLEASAEIRADRIQHQADGSRFVLVTPQGEADIWLPLPGRHNVGNALAAAALALSAGASLEQVAAGLSEAQAVPGRMWTHYLEHGAILIDDSYNANPGSLAVAIDVLANCSPLPPGEGLGVRVLGGQKSSSEAKAPHPNPSPKGRGAQAKAPSWLILGDMRELGPEAESLHAAAGEEAKKAGISQLFTLGESSAAAAKTFGEHAQHFETHDALINALLIALETAETPPVMLVKGSRGSAMERVVKALIAHEETRDAA